jgi:hypothetical protein
MLMTISSPSLGTQISVPDSTPEPMEELDTPM